MRACMCMRWFMFENCIRNVIKIAAIRFDAMRCDSPQVQVQFECGRVEEEGGGAEGHSTPIHTRQFTRFIPLSLALLSFRLPVRSQCRCLCVCVPVCVSFIYFSHVLIRCRLESAFVGLSSVCPLYLPFRRRILIHAQDRQLQHTYTHTHMH